MGVPKFFRWCAERFPTVITPFKDSPPPIDNLYLDMNGIIHNCTHPNDVDATRKSATEKEMVQAMFAYLEKLFAAIQPRKTFFMAIDGCAPRAKMNQQRQRRYRSGYEMMVAREEALKMGEEIPDEADVFDSNCITPGTEFMTRVSEHFQYFVTMKLQSDSAWQNCRIIFSGHNDPGEGEHKIVDYIRRRKMQPGYDPNETHCMYGLDADLIMLALATHEPHFVLLREVVTFGGAGSKKEQMRKQEDEAKGIKEDARLAKPDSFVLFHVNLLREFLDVDVRRGDQLPHYDLEQVMDDFVFMLFLVGNDFLPTIPTIGINDGSINVMLQIYRDHILTRGSCLMRRGELNWQGVETLVTKLGEMELDTLRARQEEEREQMKRDARRNGSHDVPVNLQPITSMAEYKQRYYTEKHKFSGGWAPRGPEMQNLIKHYCEGLAWVAHYYYQGPASWKWYFPHHYAPLASDLVNLANIGATIKFELGEPFLPHQQLLAVLPPMSYRSMPKAYWGLLRSANSPLKQYFPPHLEIDREGARAPWEGIVLIPFMDEKVLLAAYESVQSQVLPEEKARNQQGKPLLFQYSHQMVPYTLPNPMFQPLTNVRVRRINYEMPPLVHFTPALCPGVRLGAQHMEGFPSFFQRMHELSPVFEVGAVNIFGMPSRRESLLLRFDEPQQPDTVDDHAFLVGKPVWINFPHWKRARVSYIIDRRRKIKARFDKDGNFQTIESTELTNEEYRNFKKDCEAHQVNLKSKLGLIIGAIDVLVYVNRFVGMRSTRKGRLMHTYSTRETCYPLQLCEAITKLDILPDPRNIERDRDAHDFGDGQQVIYIGPDPKNHKGEPLMGSVGFVIDRASEESDLCNIVLKHYTAAQPIPPSIAEWSSEENWLRMEDVCMMLRKRLRLQISSMALSQITSSIVTSPQFGSIELGLCLKFTAKNLARIGYAKLVQTQQNPWYVGASTMFETMTGEESRDNGPRGPAGGGFTGSNASGRGTWYFSLAANDLISEFCERFRPLVERMERGGSNSNQFDISSAMTGPWVDREVSDVLHEISSWLEQKGIHKIPMSSATDDTLGDVALKELEGVLEKTTPRPTEELRLKRIAGRHMYFPTSRLPEGFVVAVPLPLKDQQFALGRRVVYCRTTGSVPFGATGTITRLIGDGGTAEVVFDEPFVGGSNLAGRLKSNRGALCKLQALIVLGQNVNIEVASPFMGTPSTTPATASAAAAAFGGGSLVANSARAAPAPAGVMSRQSSNSITVADTSGAGIVLADVERQIKTRSPADAAHAGGTSPLPAADPAIIVATRQSPGSAAMAVPAPRSVQLTAGEKRTTPSAADLLKGLQIGGRSAASPAQPASAPAFVPSPAPLPGRAPVHSAAFDLRRSLADAVTAALKEKGFA